MNDTGARKQIRSKMWVSPIIAPNENIAPPLRYIYHDWGGGVRSYLTTKLGGGGGL